MIHRVLIVDDEMRILQSLYGLLSEAFSFEIYRASSALDAQKLLMQMQFDLVITDISMPGMNGLELLKSIKRTWPRTYVILLTVYSSFEYAYEANKYDRVEYLLKIESYDEILKTVRRTVEAIEAERAQEMLHLQNELELRAVRRGVEQYLIRHCVVQGKPLPRDLNFAGIGLQPEKQSLLLCTMMVSDSEPLSICEPLSDVLEKRGLQVFSLSLQAEQIFLIQRAEANDENAPEVCISAVGEELEGLNQSAPHSFFAAFVQRFLPWEQLASAYHSAKTAMRNLYGENGVVLLGEGDLHAPEQNLLPRAFALDDINTLYALAQSASWERFLLAFEEKLAEVHPENSEDQNATVFLLNQIAHAFGEPLPDRNLLREADIAWPDAALRLAQQLFDAREQSRQQAVSWQVQQVNRYIEEHLSEDLTLTTLAKHIHYNPSYLSRIYKQQTGATLINYINTTRIRHACKLLEESSLRVNQIAEQCGICSTKYFNEAFRKAMGVTPMEYRKAHSKIS